MPLFFLGILTHMCTEINNNFDVDARGKISKITCLPVRYSIDIWLSPHNFPMLKKSNFSAKALRKEVSIPKMQKYKHAKIQNFTIY